MEFYLIERENLSKYKLEFNREELENLKTEVIENCSQISHIDEEVFKSSALSWKELAQSFPQIYEVRNYHVEKTGKYGGDGDLIVHEPIVHVICDLYTYPHLVSIINGILSGDIDLLYEFLETDFVGELKQLDKQLYELDLEIDKMSNLDKEKQKKLTELQELDDKRKNVEQKQNIIKPYYEKANLIIKKKLISSYNLNTIKEVLEFIQVPEIKSHKVLERIRNKNTYSNLSIDNILEKDNLNNNKIKIFDSPNPIIRLYGCTNIFDNLFFNTEEELMEYAKINNINLDNIYVLDYLGEYAGCRDVIRKSTINDTILYTAIDKDGYAIFNLEKSYAIHNTVWEYNYGNLSEEYAAFRKRGIIFENDPYKEYDKQEEKLIPKTRERKLNENN